MFGIQPHVDAARRPLSKDTRGFQSGRKSPDYHGSAGHPLYLVYLGFLSLWPGALGNVYHALSEAPAVAFTAGTFVLADFLLPSHARPTREHVR